MCIGVCIQWCKFILNRYKVFLNLEDEFLNMEDENNHLDEYWTEKKWKQRNTYVIIRNRFNIIILLSKDNNINISYI